MAVHILTMLAKDREAYMKSDRLAASVNTNAVVIRRVLGQLGHAGLVVSQTGAAGGTRLAKSPSDIDLSEVYRAVACGDVFALHPNAPNQDCPVGRNIESVLCNLQKEIDRSIGEKLSQFTLENVMEKIEQG